MKNERRIVPHPAFSRESILGIIRRRSARAVIISRRMMRTAAFGTTRAARLFWAQFFHRQFAVAVLVQRSQRRGGIINLARVDHAIVIGIQSGNQRRRRRAMSFLAHLRTLAARTILIVLRGDNDGGGGDCQCGDHEFSAEFHFISFQVSSLRSPSGSTLIRRFTGSRESNFVFMTPLYASEP